MDAKRKSPYQAEYEQGYDSGRKGEDMDKCPFDFGTDARIMWMFGHAAANLSKVPPK